MALFAPRHSLLGARPLSGPPATEPLRPAPAFRDGDGEVGDVEVELGAGLEMRSKSGSSGEQKTSKIQMAKHLSHGSGLQDI